MIAGLLATLMMDGGSVVLRATGLAVGLTPQLIGRWFALLARGRGVVGTIDAMPPIAGEVVIAAVAHYCIGISLTIAFLALLDAAGLRHRPRIAFVLAIAFGGCTNLLPWLVMFPAMGFGRFGSTAPREWMLMRSSCASHLFFGLGLALSSRWLGLIGSSAARLAPPASMRSSSSSSFSIGR
jgi:hypothetical protein